LEERDRLVVLLRVQGSGRSLKWVHCLPGNGSELVANRLFDFGVANKLLLPEGGDTEQHERGKDTERPGTHIGS